LAELGHRVSTPEETANALASVKDGVADTSEEYRAAGRAVGTPWSVTARIERPRERSESDAPAYRVELEVCLVETGRVESLTRTVPFEYGQVYVAQMLHLLVRPSGLANEPLPWEDEPAQTTRVDVLPAPSRVVQPSMVPEPRAFALGLESGVSAAWARPAQAVGSTLGVPIGVVAGYAPREWPGAEFRGTVAAQFFGPRALEVVAGARYAFSLVPRYRVFVGPEARAGLHVTLGGDRTARFLVGGEAFAGVGLGEALQIEVGVDVAGAFGGTGSLGLVGATARVLRRF
jgi:hypothetical protein